MTSNSPFTIHHSPFTIQDISTTVFRLPLHGKLQWGKHSVLNEVQHVLVRVHLSNGAEGIAEAPPRPTIYGETVHSITSIIKHELKPRLIGQPAHDLSAMHQIKNNHTAKGAIDMAVHDALAKSKDIPLTEHLIRITNYGLRITKNTYSVNRNPSSVQVSYILGIGDDETVLAEAQRVFDQGVRVLKVKVGRDWDADVRRIAALQAMFGDEMAIYADANECLGTETPALSTTETAVSQLTQLAEMGVLYCEEPLPVEQIQKRAALRAGHHLPLIADDSTFTVRDLRRELSLNTFDILNIKTARTGFTKSAKMLAMAQAAGKGVMIGSQASAALGTARAGQFAALPGVNHPSELSFFLKLKEDVVRKRPLIHNGFISIEELNQVEIDEDLLRDAEVEI